MSSIVLDMVIAAFVQNAVIVSRMYQINALVGIPGDPLIRVMFFVFGLYPG